GVAQLGGDRVLRLCEQEQSDAGEDEEDQDAGDERGGREDPVAGADDSLRSSALTGRSRWLRLGSWWGVGPGGVRLGDLCAGRHKCSSRDLWWNPGGPKAPKSGAGAPRRSRGVVLRGERLNSMELAIALTRRPRSSR